MTADGYSIKTKSWLAILSLVMGVVIGGLALWLYLLAGRLQVGLLLGPLFVLIGVSQLRKPTFKLDPDGLGAYNAFGMRMKLRPLDELEAETEASGRKVLFHRRPGGRRSIVFSTTAFAFDNEQIRMVIDAIEARKAA